ncbi:MAG TPA: AMP-dependent synthetase/ligase [Pirellulales bacterium]|nr:AMP-dependent synthetase/ligase [Pirellulales bacterium]
MFPRSADPLRGYPEQGNDFFLLAFSFSMSATILSLLAARVDADAELPAISFRRDGAWQTRPWSALADDVRRTAAVLVELGATPGDRVAQVSPNRYEWIVADLAIQMACAVHVPVHATLAAPQIAFQIIDSGARVVLLSGVDLAAKLATYSEADGAAPFPAELKFVSFDPCPRPVGPFKVALLADLTGHVDPTEARRTEEAASRHVGPDDLATILYTSGTTGEPKGVMLSQRNLASNALATLEAFCQQSSDLRLAWLPLSHIFARTCDLYTSIAGGCQIALADSPEQVTANCRELHPTLINGVPYFYEKVMRYLVDHQLADLPGALATAFGGRLRAACSGGAPLPDHVTRFYNERGVFLAQGYGLTESSPVITLGTPTAMKIGTVGRPAPGVEVKISDEGEIVTRGPHVMLGYWNKPEATAEAFRDGWLRTGDLGELDAEGFLTITGRKKELIVTSAGKKIAPVHVEALLTADPLIERAVVIGDRRGYLVALVIPNHEALAAELARLGIQLASSADVCTHAGVLAIYRQRIDERLAGVSQYEQVGKFTLLEQPLSIERGELTLTLKLRRQAIEANYAEVIERMYRT